MANLTNLRREILLHTPHIETASGEIASFTTDMVRPLKGLVVPFSPVQDLHGYDNPWPAGGGVNKLNPAEANDQQSGGPIGGLASEWNATEGYYRLYGTYTSSSSSQAFRAINIPNAIRSFNVKGFDSSGHASCRWQSEENRIVIDLINMVQNTSYDIKVYPVVYEGSTAPTKWSPYSNECPISGWTGLHGGNSQKNIFDQSVFATLTGWDESDGVYTGNSAQLPALGDFIQYYPKEGKQFAVSFDAIVNGSSRAGYIWFYYTDGTTSHMQIVGNAWAHYSAVSTSGKTVSEIVFTKSNNVTLSFKNFQIEVGSASTDYEKFNGYTIAVDWEDEAGTVYGANIELATGILSVSQYRRFRLSSSWTWYRTSVYGNYYFNTSAYRAALNQNKLPILMCDQFKAITRSDGQLNDGNIPDFTITNAWARYYPLNIRYDALESVDDFKTFLSENEVYALIPSVTDVTTYQLDPVTVSTLLGENNIWTDTNEDLTAQYWSHI